MTKNPLWLGTDMINLMNNFTSPWMNRKMNAKHFDSYAAIIISGTILCLSSSVSSQYKAIQHVTQHNCPFFSFTLILILSHFIPYFNYCLHHIMHCHHHGFCPPFYHILLYLGKHHISVLVHVLCHWWWSKCLAFIFLFIHGLVKFFIKLIMIGMTSSDFGNPLARRVISQAGSYAFNSIECKHFV